MYWRVLKISETDDTITYCWGISSNKLTGIFSVNKKTLDYKIIKQADFKASEFMLKTAVLPRIRIKIRDGELPNEYEYKAG